MYSIIVRINRAEGALSSSGRIPIVDFCSVRILLSLSTTLLITFAHTAKKGPSELESELQNIQYILLEKINTKVDSLYQPKNRCISDPEMCYNARF